MSDDDETSRRPTRESVLDQEQLDELRLPDFPDRDEFVKTQEIDVAAVRGFETKPDMAALDSTQRYEIPHDLLQMAMRSQEMPIVPSLDEDSEPEWKEFVAIVDPHGRIFLPSRLQQQLKGKKLRVRYVVEGE